MSRHRDVEEVKTILGSVIAAVGASACCLGPVALSAIGAGAIGAAAVKLEPLRPVFLTITAALLGTAFFVTYRRAAPDQCGPGDSCAPSSKRTAKVVLWLATILVVLLVTFPYYINWLV